MLPRHLDQVLERSVAQMPGPDELVGPAAKRQLPIDQRVVQIEEGERGHDPIVAAQGRKGGPGVPRRAVGLLLALTVERPDGRRSTRIRLLAQ